MLLPSIKTRPSFNPLPLGPILLKQFSFLHMFLNPLERNSRAWGSLQSPRQTPEGLSTFCEVLMRLSFSQVLLTALLTHRNIKLFSLENTPKIIKPNHQSVRYKK